MNMALVSVKYNVQMLFSPVVVEELKIIDVYTPIYHTRNYFLTWTNLNKSACLKQ